MKEELTELSDKERDLIKTYADQRGLTIEEAASELARDGLARRVRKRTGKSPARNVLKMRKTRS